MNPVLQEDKDQINGVNYLAISPRYSFMMNRLAGGIDLGLYSYTEKEYDVSDQSYFICPKIAFTFPADKIFDFTVTTKIDFYPGDGELFWGLNLGGGLYPPPGNWSIRPEIGLMKHLAEDLFSPEVYFTWGIALILSFDTNRQSTD